MSLCSGAGSGHSSSLGLARTPSDQIAGLVNCKRDSSSNSEPTSTILSTSRPANGHVRTQSLDLKGGHVRTGSSGSQKMFLSLRKVSV